MDVDAGTKTCYEKKKPSIYKWRENNKEKYSIILPRKYVIVIVIKLKPYIIRHFLVNFENESS